MEFLYLCYAKREAEIDLHSCRCLLLRREGEKREASGYKGMRRAFHCLEDGTKGLRQALKSVFLRDDAEMCLFEFNVFASSIQRSMVHMFRLFAPQVFLPVAYCWFPPSSHVDTAILLSAEKLHPGHGLD